MIQRIGTSATFNPNRKGLILLLGIAVLGLIAIHTASAWAWAGVFLTVGEFTELSKALYFSVVTSTTLGYGDITLSERWLNQLLVTPSKKAVLEPTRIRPPSASKLTRK